jgi:hypothetical protein
MLTGLNDKGIDNWVTPNWIYTINIELIATTSIVRHMSTFTKVPNVLVIWQ